MVDVLERRPALAGRRFANDAVTLAPATPRARLSLRGDAEAASETLGHQLPREPNRSSRNGERTALWLGPDEWLVIDAGAEVPDVPHGEGFSATDVSHRNVGLEVCGAGARNTLAAGCPRDLSLEAFPVNACARTVLGKAEVVIHRTGDNAFHVECWRSFAPYVWAFLEDAAQDAVL